MDDAPGERHLNIHFTPEIMAGVYANFANVSHSPYEFTIKWRTREGIKNLPEFDGESDDDYGVEEEDGEE